MEEDYWATSNFFEVRARHILYFIGWFQQQDLQSTAYIL